MAKSYSKKNCYPSAYGGGYITPAQYLVELICLKKAKRDKSGDLPLKFWRLPKWEKYFRWQIKLANNLLREHQASFIVKALNSKECSYIYNLNSPILARAIVKAEEEIGPKELADWCDKYGHLVKVIKSTETLSDNRPSISNIKTRISKLDE